MENNKLTIIPNFAQERGLAMLRREWKQHNSFMVYAPTGAGKTGLAAFITAGCVSRGMKVMMVCPFTVLINQTAQRFVQYGLSMIFKKSTTMIIEKYST